MTRIRSRLTGSYPPGFLMEGKNPMPDSGAYVIPDREKELRRTLPDLHVGLSRTGKWHILGGGGFSGPLCGRSTEIEEDGPLESASPGQLCKVCANIQGPEYADVW